MYKQSLASLEKLVQSRSAAPFRTGSVALETDSMLPPPLDLQPPAEKPPKKAPAHVVRLSCAGS